MNRTKNSKSLRFHKPKVNIFSMAMMDWASQIHITESYLVSLLDADHNEPSTPLNEKPWRNKSTRFMSLEIHTRTHQKHSHTFMIVPPVTCFFIIFFSLPAAWWKRTGECIANSCNYQEHRTSLEHLCQKWKWGCSWMNACTCGWVHTPLRRGLHASSLTVRTDKSCQPQVMQILLQKQRLCHFPASSPAILVSWMQGAMKWEAETDFFIEALSRLR